MENYILRDTYFKVDPNGDGGYRRTSQIDELIRSAEFGISDIVKNLPLSSTSRWSRYINGIRMIVKHRFKIYPSYKMIGYCGYLYQKYQQALNQHRGKKILLWEENREQYYMIPYAAKDADFQIIAAPHNLESLFLENIDHFTHKSLPDSLKNEIKHLSLADVVFCISREEQWLLKLFGIDADFLPYYPPQSVLSNLLKVRQLRQPTQENKFLILGTAGNRITKMGIIELIKLLKIIQNKIEFKVDIAGYGTEILKKHCDDINLITLHGTVEPEKLNQLLISTKAVLIYQRSGVGALTRIPEMLIAGIPVIANSNACRSAFGYHGVYCYDNLDELAELMSRKLDSTSVPQRPKKAEKRFIDCLKKMAQ